MYFPTEALQRQGAGAGRGEWAFLDLTDTLRITSIKKCVAKKTKFIAKRDTKQRNLREKVENDVHEINDKRKLSM